MIEPAGRHQETGGARAQSQDCPVPESSLAMASSKNYSQVSLLGTWLLQIHVSLPSGDSKECKSTPSSIYNYQLNNNQGPPVEYYPAVITTNVQKPLVRYSDRKGLLEYQKE